MIGENNVVFGENINRVRIQQNRITGTICESGNKSITNQRTLFRIIGSVLNGQKKS